LLTLMLLWPRPAVPVVANRPASPPVEVRPPGSSESPSLWELRNQAVASEGLLPPPAPVADLAAPDPPLHAFAAPDAALFQ
jgi:hypothetical protein